jgi:diguanylate cyclase (GGDEF)-like protein
MELPKPRLVAATEMSPPSPVDQASTGGHAIDLLPIPAAIAELEDERLVLRAINSAFVQAGLGETLTTTLLTQLLGGRIDAFLRSGATRHELAWCCGTEIDARYYTVTFARREDAGLAARCLVTLVDVTGERRTETNLRREMLSDSLTGLPNRAGFDDVIDEAVTSGDRDGLAVLVINLARFSGVNACLGPLAGDELLISVARRIKGALRGRDVLARTGGDEFAILAVVEDGGTGARQLAQRIEAAFATPFLLSGFEIRVACSIGIALGADATRASDDLVRRAQIAVKQAKASGRHEIYHPESFALMRSRFAMETELRRAVENGELKLTYQPICDLATGRVVSFESLARWTRDGVEVSPADFIPVAEECGLIVPLGRWALSEAASTLAEWKAAHGSDPEISLAVNLSAIQLQRDDVPRLVADALGSHGLGGQSLTLELTESAIVSDPDRVAATMHALKGLGTTLAMDDFGTGYSNLAYLQKLPIDLLKIDRSFITGMLADRDKVAIVRAILGLATALGMRTTAEGVETNELAQTLAALGCTNGQGYFYAHPLPAAAAYELLVARNA